MNLFTKVILTVFLTMSLYVSSAQSVAINTTGSMADTSAILDLVNSAKGLLIPRMTAVQRTAIFSPATGLLIFQTDAPAGFYYNNGTASSPVWVFIQNSASGSINGMLTTAAQPNITSVGALSNLTVTGNINGGTFNGALSPGALAGITSLSNLSALTVTGAINAGSISASTINGTLATAAQPNITSVGALSNLTVTGNINGGTFSGTLSPGTIAGVQKIEVQLIGTNYTALVTDGLIYTTTSLLTFTLPSAAAAGKGKILYFRGTGTAVTFSVSRAGSDTIESVTSALSIVTGRTSSVLVSDGLNKWIEISFL